MALIDKNQDNISNGDYLEICNNLKKVHQEKEKPHKGKWDDIMEKYIWWKQYVRLAMKAESNMKRVNDLYEAYENPQIQTEEAEILFICIKHHIKKNNITEPTEADYKYVRENLELVCQDIVDENYTLAYRQYKYQADECWKELTKHPKFEEFLDLLSPVELHMHRALCEPQFETGSRIYRQIKKTVKHDGHYIKKEFTWFSHEREYPEADDEEDEFDDFDNEELGDILEYFNEL
tara:strand:+ start:13361 stop:14065 length:705 start_codon:yes stop_codon:yes gene_type:complete